jgi:hypothetical protein
MVQPRVTPLKLKADSPPAKMVPPFYAAGSDTL